MEQEIIERNKVIFDFMGCKHSDDELIDKWEMETLKYHRDWSSLMPVILKIGEVIDIADSGIEEKYYTYPVTFGMKDSEGNFMFRFYAFSLHYGKTLIEAAFNAVVEIILWYNSQVKETIKP